MKYSCGILQGHIKSIVFRFYAVLWGKVLNTWSEHQNPSRLTGRDSDHLFRCADWLLMWGVLLTANQVKRTPFSEGLRRVENSRRESFWILCSLAAELNVSGFISMMLCSVWTLFTFLWLKEVLSAMQPCLVNIKKVSVQPCCGHKFQTTPSTMKNLFLFPPAWNQTPLKCHRTRSVIMLNTGSVKWCCEAFVSCSV